jgi:uncharacterized protein YdhG (YjbR/CyaY superfamily)
MNASKSNVVDEFDRYANAQSKKYAEICTTLRKEIDSALPKAASKIYYSMPVWFIDENAVVGYKASANNVNLLFWNGQSFNEKELIAAGKFHAAQIKYSDVSDIDVKNLRRWLRKAKTDIWDLKSLRAGKEPGA